MKYFKNVRTAYQETSMPYEDFLQWFVTKHLSWGARWGLVLLLYLAFHLFLLQPSNFLVLFYLMLVLLGVYVMGLLVQAVALVRAYLIGKSRKS